MLTLRLSEDEFEALRRKAADEGRSMQAVVRAAINRYVSAAEDAEFETMVATIVERDHELLDRLAQGSRRE